MINLCYQSHKYNLLINIFSTLWYNHCCKNNRPNILIIERYMHNEVGTCTEIFWRYGTKAEVSIEGGYRRWTAGYFALSRRLLSSQIVLDISQKRSIAVFLESKIALNLIS